MVVLALRRRLATAKLVIAVGGVALAALAINTRSAARRRESDAAWRSLEATLDRQLLDRAGHQLT